MTTTVPEPAEQPTSLTTAAARNLATTTKSVPQMQGISSRWLLRVLPWVEVSGGTYRVNRRLSYTVGDGRIDCVTTGASARVIPNDLGELRYLRGFGDEAALGALADRFVQTEWEAGETVVEAGTPADQLYVMVHGKAERVGTGEYGEPVSHGIVGDGGYFGEDALVADDGSWEHGVRAATACTMLVLSRRDFAETVARDAGLRGHVEAALAAPAPDTDAGGEAAIALSSGHEGEPVLPATYVAYETAPREYELSVAQTVLRVHTRVADLYNEPMNQVEQQLRLTVEALRERQEHELVNNRDFGLLHNADPAQRLTTRSGPPTPDDLDDLLAVVWKDPAVFLAHPQTIGAFGRECSRRGLYPATVDIGGRQVPAWRGVPILTCNKIPISGTRTSSILLMRTGEQAQGVVGLHQTGLPDEYEPGLNARFMGIDDQAVLSYLVSAYYSAAVLVPDALGVLEGVELGHAG
ncbi:family 2B encapsulin nanocompartment shell protein [Actinomadura parmotrematis]|uniref:Cyclic nucleotide-binding domain-containing protein n=1 Tax=Actinomadura parmotrematis TaxID=2864039 RepID=A0ABS7FLM0_9ACTN|nr:family 2B encapsulin nanocompartment shell protein [Actinomadura parmotrematis]MBW8481244.1 cyclic nucleotide-binding domain-containing protein [Actinomadura parmotrematis]